MEQDNNQSKINSSFSSNKIYYGEYSLYYWIELILKKNIILPPYQRCFVWNKDKAKNLIESLKNQYFIPPVTIGKYIKENSSYNYIVDGQQRLTSILLVYLKKFPIKDGKKYEVSRYADDNDDQEQQEEINDNILDWTIKELTDKGTTRNEIIESISNSNFYEDFSVEGIDDDFLKKHFIGFSYLVPVCERDEQQKFYATVFRNINNEGVTLIPLESRRSLYYLDEKLVGYFDPEFCKQIKIGSNQFSDQLDFVRYLALLASEKYIGNANVARGYKSKMENFYEEYIYSVINNEESKMFGKFVDKENCNLLVENLKNTFIKLALPKKYHSIIDADISFIGLIYWVLFEKRDIDVDKTNSIQQDLKEKIEVLKKDASHTKSPGAFKNLRKRISDSIEIYKKYLKSNEQA